MNGYKYCEYFNKNPKDYYIFNIGDFAEITGDGGIYNGCVDYFNEFGVNLNYAYLPKHRDFSNKTYPPPESFVGKKVFIKNRKFWADCGTKICLVTIDGWDVIIGMEYLKPLNRKGYCMNNLIVEMFPKTKDAVLVEKWFGKDITTEAHRILFKGKEKELLESAENLEQQELNKKTK